MSRERSNSDPSRLTVPTAAPTTPVLALRRERASTQQLTPRTPRNQAAATSYTRVLHQQDLAAAASSSASSSSSSSSPPPLPAAGATAEAQVQPVSNLNQEEVDARLAEALRIEAAERQRRRQTAAARAKSVDMESVPWPADTSRLVGLTATLPRYDDDDEDSTSDEPTAPGDDMFIDTSPRSESSQSTLARAKKNVMTQFLDGLNCNYSFTDLHDVVWVGLVDNTRERFWVGQCMNENAHKLPDMDKLISNAQLPKRVYDSIIADLYRTSPEAAHANSLFINTLYRGLIAHAALRPDIGYVQGMNMLWANIIICISKPQHQLLVAEHIVTNVLPYYFTTDVIGAAIDASVLRYYMRRRCTKLDKLMNDTLGGDLQTMCQAMTSSWFTTMFSVQLCTSQRKRLWDMIMLRGAVVLFEFILRLFIYSHKHRWMSGCTSWPEYKAQLDRRLAELNTIDGVLTTRLPSGRIVHEDFEARRRVATRVVFAMLQDSPRNKK